MGNTDSVPMYQISLEIPVLLRGYSMLTLLSGIYRVIVMILEYFQLILRCSEQEP